MTSWQGSQGAELEAAAHSDVPTANSMGSMRGTAAPLPVSNLTVKDLGQGMLSPTRGSAARLHLRHQDNTLQACSETWLPGESRFHQSDHTEHHKAQQNVQGKNVQGKNFKRKFKAKWNRSKTEVLSHKSHRRSLIF